MVGVPRNSQGAPQISPSPIRRSLLVIHDDRNDAAAIAGAFANDPYDVTPVAREDAMPWLDAAKRTGAPAVALTFIASDLARAKAFDILRAAHASPVAGLAPIIVMGRNASAENIEKAYYLGANSFVALAKDRKEQDETLKAVRTYWTKVAMLPR